MLRQLQPLVVASCDGQPPTLVLLLTSAPVGVGGLQNTLISPAANVLSVLSAADLQAVFQQATTSTPAVAATTITSTNTSAATLAVSSATTTATALTTTTTTTVAAITAEAPLIESRTRQQSVPSATEEHTEVSTQIVATGNCTSDRPPASPVRLRPVLNAGNVMHGMHTTTTSLGALEPLDNDEPSDEEVGSEPIVDAACEGDNIVVESSGEVVLERVDGPLEGEGNTDTTAGGPTRGDMEVLGMGVEGVEANDAGEDGLLLDRMVGIEAGVGEGGEVLDSPRGGPDLAAISSLPSMLSTSIPLSLVQAVAEVRALAAPPGPDVSDEQLLPPPADLYLGGATLRGSVVVALPATGPPNNRQGRQNKQEIRPSQSSSNRRQATATTRPVVVSATVATTTTTADRQQQQQRDSSSSSNDQDNLSTACSSIDSTAVAPAAVRNRLRAHATLVTSGEHSSQLICVEGRIRGGRARTTTINATNQTPGISENKLTSSNPSVSLSGHLSRATEASAVVPGRVLSTPTPAGARTRRPGLVTENVPAEVAAAAAAAIAQQIEEGGKKLRRKGGHHQEGEKAALAVVAAAAEGPVAPLAGEAALQALEPELLSPPSVSSGDAGSPERPCHPCDPQDQEHQEPSHPVEDPEDPSAMIDTSEFRAGLGDGYHPSGRMSPGGSFASNASSYATLTPLQPLPPISTMSDKFSHYGHPHPNAGFSSLMPAMGMGSYPMGGYDKLGPMGGINVGSVSPPSSHGQAPMLGHANAAIPSPPYSQNGAGGGSSGMASPQLTDKGLSSYESYSHASRELARLGSPQSPTSSVALHSPTMLAGLNGLGGLNGLSAHTPPSANLAAPATPPHQDVKPFTATSITSVTGSSTPPASLPRSMTQVTGATGLSVGVANSAPAPSPTALGASNKGGVPGGLGVPTQKQSHSTSSSASSADEVEEINTKELAQRISAELKRYSIPQAIFAQRVLCRSQGTLSDLLRNPKPWSKLKSGRETFRRMYKWLEEPEFQRMSALRLAGR